MHNQKTAKDNKDELGSKNKIFLIRQEKIITVIITLLL